MLIVQICSISKCDLSAVRGNNCLPLYVSQRNPKKVIFVVTSSAGYWETNSSTSQLYTGLSSFLRPGPHQQQSSHPTAATICLASVWETARHWRLCFGGIADRKTAVPKSSKHLTQMLLSEELFMWKKIVTFCYDGGSHYKEVIKHWSVCRKIV